MFNKCLSIGLLGKDQNYSKFDPSISLLRSMWKLLEKHMTQRVIYFLKKTRELSPKQLGFKEGVSIDNALESLLTTIGSHKRNKMHVAVVSIDIKGAFDNLKYSSIVKTLSNSQCPPKLQPLFTNLLKDRNVIIPNDEGVAQQPQNRGCKQGSCSGT
ncbi:hypothetical protein AVEN_185014-1 [Araneus ventricosus]|uniref:Reverse transcriptase domain-containing protein n=1 Tax=Araneus ventricosus TaxID=182803 RepID=A0A4Y2BPP9_ARAVE|nr:hypothetical protein AVEN_185014-1 [Araneus ventricosus]